MILFVASAVLTLVAVVGFGLIWVRRTSETQRQAFEALAARRGWSLHITNQSLGRPPLLRLSSRGGPLWSAQMSATNNSFSLNRHRHMSEFSGEEPKWHSGYAFIGPAPPESDDLPMSPEQQRMWTRANIIGDGMGADLSGLELQEAPENLTVLATASPHLRIDLTDLSKLWKAWKPFDPQGQSRPIILLSPHGLRVRIWYGASTSDQMEQLIDFALTVSRTIGNR